MLNQSRADYRLTLQQEKADSDIVIALAGNKADLCGKIDGKRAVPTDVRMSCWRL